MAEAGPAQGPPVLLVHGWGASLYMWRGWFAPLAAAGHRVLAIDLPGHGLSDKPTAPGSYDVAAQVRVLTALLDALELGRVDVVGQSMGASIALDAALRGEGRLDRLVLVNPATFGRVRGLALARRVPRRLPARLLPRLVPRWLVSRSHRLVLGDPGVMTERDVDEYWAPSQFPEYVRAMLTCTREFSFRRAPVSELAARLRARGRPVLVLLGTRDRLVRGGAAYAAALQAAGAPVEVRLVDGGGHAVNEERPAETATLALAFLHRR